MGRRSEEEGCGCYWRMGWRWQEVMMVMIIPCRTPLREIPRMRRGRRRHLSCPLTCWYVGIGKCFVCIEACIVSMNIAGGGDE